MNEFFEIPNAKQTKSSVERGRDRTDVSIRAITVRHCAPPLARAGGGGEGEEDHFVPRSRLLVWPLNALGGGPARLRPSTIPNSRRHIKARLTFVVKSMCRYATFDGSEKSVT